VSTTCLRYQFLDRWSLPIFVLFQFLVRFLAVPFSFHLFRAVSLQAPKSGFLLYPSDLHYALCLRVVLTRLGLHYALCLRVALTRLVLHYALFLPCLFLLNLDSTRLPGLVCVNPHPDLVCITPFFLLFLLCLFCWTLIQHDCQGIGTCL
jgi:hypothetical protein